MLQRVTRRNNESLGPSGLGAQILSLATAVPKHRIAQSEAVECVTELFPSMAHLESVFANTGIDTRYSCVPIDWFLEPHRWPDRNEIYQESALALLEDAARKAISGAGLESSDIGAVVVISSTGLSVPSLDARLANRLGLKACVERLPIFGLGCAGGVTGLARAARLASGGTPKNILMLTVELCTLSFRLDDDRKAMFVSSALFGDGAAAVILRHGNAEQEHEPGPKQSFHIIAAGEHLWPDSEAIMGWSVEDDGFGVVISTQIPQFARNALKSATCEFLDRHGLELNDLAGFVTHPGGRKVLEAIEDTLEVDRAELCHAWDVLRDYGNMSSPTVLFVLQRALVDAKPGIHLMVALGPGFTVSFALLEVRNN